jgi:hypothetical protein
VYWLWPFYFMLGMPSTPYTPAGSKPGGVGDGRSGF